MTGNEIFKKYWEGLLTVSHDVKDVSDAAVALALRLAIADGVTVGRSIEGLEAVTLRQRIERKDAQLLDLQTALDLTTREADGLRQQVMQLDADAASLLRQVRELEAWKTVAIECNGQAATPSSSPIVVLTDFGAPGAGVTLPAAAPSLPIAAAPAPDGATARTSASSVSTNGMGAPASVSWWNDLDTESNDWRISLDAGRRKFRDLPKAQRLTLAQAFLRGLALTHGGTAAGMPGMADYDDQKPEWMPTGSSLTKTFNCGWSELLDVRQVAEP